MFTVIVLVNFIYGNAQQTKIDSLRYAINSTKVDTAKIFLYENLGQAYRDEKKIDSSILSYQHALKINEENNFSMQKQCWDIATIDYLLYITGNYTESLKYATRNVELCKNLNDTFQMGFCHATFGHDYKALGEYRLSLNHYFKARQIFKLYLQVRNVAENDPYIIQCIGDVYLKMNQLDSALIYTQQSLVQKGLDPGNELYSIRILGDIYRAKGDDQRALNYYREYIPGFIKYNTPDFIEYKQNSRDLGFVFNNMAKIFQKRGETDSAIFYAKKALTNAEEYHDQQNIYDASNVLSELYAKKDEYKKEVNQNTSSNNINTPGNEIARAKIDSLKKLVLKIKADTSKIVLYENLGQAYRDEKIIDSSIVCYQQALSINERHNYSAKKQHDDIGTIDYLLYTEGKYSLSLQYASKVLQLSEKVKDTLTMAHAHLMFGQNYTSLGNYQMALNNYLIGKRLLELYNHPTVDLESPAATYELIGELYIKMNRTDSALFYIQKAFRLANKYHFGFVIDYCLRMFGNIALLKNDYASAINYYRQYVSNYNKYNDNNRDICFAYYNMSSIYKERRQIDSAIFYAKQDLITAQEFRDQENIYSASKKLSDLYHSKNNTHSVTEAYQEPVMNSKIDRNKINSLKNGLNDSLNNESLAFKYYKIAQAAKDSMASIEKIRQIQALTFNEQVREKEQQEADAKQAAKTKRLIIIASILVSIIAFLIWNRVRQLRLKYKSILEQKESEKLKTQLLELEAKALRAQMNPHFIFNCMNSIKLLMQQNENEKAITYLTTFSKLIRTIFQNSDKREITLHDEIGTCKLYTQLESLRFADKFNYTFSIDETIDLKLLMVPALIIQPFIENAIWHGIMPKEDGGCVNMNIERTGENVLCIIDDDGIGRETSKQNKFKSDAHESKGVHLTQSRIDLDNLINQRNASLEIIDKKDEHNISSGTRVILTFKEY